MIVDTTKEKIERDLEHGFVVPDEELYNIVRNRSPKSIYNRIPEVLRKLILNKIPIPT